MTPRHSSLSQILVFSLIISLAPGLAAQGNKDSLEEWIRAEATANIEAAHNAGLLYAPATDGTDADGAAAKSLLDKMSAFNCIPSCDTNDGRFLVIANGPSFVTLSDPVLELQIQVPAGAPSFDIGFFDGDGSEGGGGSFWDFGSAAPFAYSLRADPFGDGNGATIVEMSAGSPSVSSTTMPNNDWIDFNVLTTAAAQSPSGNYFYRLTIELTNLTLDTLNAFKVRTSAVATIEPFAQPFSYIANWTGGNDIFTIYPAFPATASTTYDGDFNFFFRLPGDQTELVLWGGDFDRGRFDGADSDTDDLDTPIDDDANPATPFPPWNTVDGRPEGVATGTGVSTGNPPDDGEVNVVLGPFTGQFLNRPPSVEFDVIFPNGLVIANLNPSGNQEWEQFVISSDPACDSSASCVPAGTGPSENRFGFPCADVCIATPVPAGTYELRIRGVDMQNLNALRLPEPLVCVGDLGEACETLQPFELGDTVFLDQDGNGTQDPGDNGLQGVIVDLLNDQGQVQSSAVTDANGNYLFPVPAGTFTVRVSSKNFVAPSVTGAVGDRVWLDANTDGNQGFGEPGIANVQVFVFSVGDNGIPGDADDLFYAATRTDRNGNYLVGKLPPGTYYAQVDDSSLPPGLTLTGGSDPSATRTITSGEVFLGLDFGYGNAGATASIGDFVWSDADGDGTQDAGEPGIAGVTLDLIDNGTATVVATTTTRSDGSYLFSGVAPGSYSVDVTDTAAVLAGYSLTAGPQSGTDPTAPIVVAAGEVFLGADFGYNNASLVDITDVVWFDGNRNGALDGGESGLANVTVSLLDAAARVIASTVTDTNGAVTFSGVADGNYFLRITDLGNLVAGFLPTTNGALARRQAVTVAGINLSATSFGYIDSGALEGLTGTTLKAPEGDFDAQVDTITNNNIFDYDFGYSTAASVGDRVWQDNGDGLQQPGEPGINGVTVRLLDAGGNEIATTVTTGDGGYEFTGLRPAEYTVEVVTSTLPAGLDQATFDLDGTLDSRTTVTLGPGDARTDVDFGYRGTGSIGDRLWEDDGNGSQDPGEPGVNGATVRLLDAGGIEIATTVTSGDGNYLFANLPVGTFTVVVDGGTLPASLAQTFDLDGTLDNRTTVTLGSGEDRTDVDFGYARILSTLGDRVWLDQNGNGTQDPGEPGINGVLVTLLDGGGNPVATKVTSIDGNYRFFSLLPDNYTVTVDTGPLTGLIQTFDLDGLGTPNSAAKALGSGENPVDVDFGYRGDTILCAEEAIRDPDLLQFPGFDGHAFWLPGIGTDFIFDPDSGVVEIRDDGTATLSGIIRRSSNALEAFDVLIDFSAYSGPAPPGSPIEELDPGAYVPTGPIDSKTFFYYDHLVGLLSGVDDFAGAVLEVAKYSDAGFQVGFGANGKNGNYGASSWLTTTIVDQPDSGATLVITDRGDINIDLIACPLGSIGDRIWEDLDGDGVQDTGEVGINGVTVNLLDSGGAVIATTVTTGDGIYTFDNLLPGDYTVEVLPSTLPTGLDEATFDADGTLDSRTDLMLAPGEDRNDVDFGYRGSGSIGDRVWQDLDGDGIQEAGEPGINGVTVNLLDNGGTVIATTVTTGDGGYSFDNLPAGEHTVDIVTSTLPAGVDEATFDLDGTLDNRTTITLGAGQDRTDLDFGYRPSGSLGDRVWLDDGDGIQEAGEPGINGVTVHLLDSGGAVIATTVTSGDGGYSFDGLLPGDYTVEVVTSTLPAGVDTQTFDLDGTLDSRTSVTLGAGQDRTDLDFGYRVGLATLGDRVWLDLNGNGAQDTGEVGIDGVTVDLLDAGNTVIASVVTAGGGGYLFTNIPAGTYTVEVDTSTLPVDLVQTFDLDGLGSPNRATVVIAPGETNLDVDFGYVSECLPGIDFETDAAGSALAAGQIIDDEWASLGVHVTTHDPVGHPAMIFDSANPTGGDADLGTPNQSFGGPGVGSGGAAGRPGENAVPLGNVLIISEDGDTSDPDDNGAGGSLIFTFDHPVRVDGIQILDIDEGMAGTVKAFDATGAMIGTTGMLNNLGDNSVQTLVLGFSGVSRLEVTFPGSGAIAALQFCESVCLPNLDFEIDGEGNGITAGQIIDDEWAALGITVSTGDPSHPAMIFDSANPTGGDTDLGTPNLDFGGPGVGAGGAAGQPGESSRALDKVLIISEDGDSSDPDDNGSGGTLTFSFDREVFIASVDVLDIDGPESMGTVTAFDAAGNPLASAGMLPLGDNSFQTVALNTSGVRRLDVTFPKSGAVGAVTFCGVCEEIDFELDGQGNGLERGRIIDNEYAAIGMHVTTDDPSNHPAMIFDSSNPTGGDADLGSPNQTFGGPGVGSGGEAGKAGENGVALGNVLIISEDRDSNDPDDNGAGGTLIFTFDAPVFIESVGILDIDGAEAMGVVRALDASGVVIASAPMLELGNNSFQTVAVGAAGTRRLEVIFPKSGAVSSIIVCGDATKGGGGGACAGDISVRDEFNAQSFGSNDGNDSWAGDWVEDDPQGGGPGSGQVRVKNNALRLDDYPNTGGTPGASRTVDLSGTTSATFSFGFDTSSGVDATDAVAVEVSSDGGATWTVLETITNLVGEHWEDRSFDISAFISDQTTVRFRVTQKYGGSDEFFWADNVQIVATCDGEPNTPPTAHFTVDTSDLQASFHEMSNDPDGQVTTWGWEFGDGQSSDVQNPVHTYSAAGTYTVTLTATDDDGASHSVSETVTVTAPSGSGSPCGDCEHYNGWLGHGDWHAQPDGNYYHSSSGVQEGWLEGPADADFDLELFKWSSGRWNRVARSISYSSSEHIHYNGGEGYYYWAVVSYNGNGDYDFWLHRP